jgi:opacity protein-like surface antigen
MRKLFCACAVIAVSAGQVFALPDFSLSAGGGGIFNIHWKDAALLDEYKDYSGGDYGHGITAPTEQTQDAMRQGLFDTKDLTVGGGVYGFFDATYAEAGAALIFNHVRQTVAIPNLPSVSPTLTGEETHEFLFIQINLSLMLKYPFSIGQKVKIFPLAGIDGQIAIGNYDENMEKDFQKIANMGYDMPTLGEFWNSLWIKAGVGADFSLNDRLFIRSEVLYGIKLNSKYDTDMADYWAEDLKGVANGLNVRIGLGYTFKTL